MLENRCPILPNWSMNKNGICKRYFFCSEERHKICKAKDEAIQTTKRFAKSQKSCLHKYTRTEPTQDRVFIDGEERKVVEIICKECGFTRRMVL